MGRRIYVSVPPDREHGFPSTMVYDCRVNGFKRFLPAGPVAIAEPSATDSLRKDHLVQLYTDPGGQRVLAVATIHLKDPRKRKK